MNPRFKVSYNLEMPHFAFPRRPGYARGIFSPWTGVPPMKASYRVAILACAAWGGIACSVVRGDFLQASGTATSVGVSLTVASGQFGGTLDATASANTVTQGQNPPASFGPLSSTVSVGPLQASDAQTAATAQSFGMASSSLLNGGQTLSILTSSYASATSAFSASAAAGAGTPTLGVILAPFSQRTSAVFDVNLMSDFGSNPASAYTLQALEGGTLSSAHSGGVSIATSVESSIGLIFEIVATTSFANGNTLFSLQYFSDIHFPQPIFASDFIPGPNGTFSLDPSKREFQIPFTIPAGVNFRYDVHTDNSAQVVPEPSTLALAALGFLALAAWRLRRR